MYNMHGLLFIARKEAITEYKSQDIALLVLPIFTNTYLKFLLHHTSLPSTPLTLPNISVCCKSFVSCSKLPFSSQFV